MKLLSVGVGIFLFASFTQSAISREDPVDDELAEEAGVGVAAVTIGG